MVRLIKVTRTPADALITAKGSGILRYDRNRPSKDAPEDKPVKRLTTREVVLQVLQEAGQWLTLEQLMEEMERRGFPRKKSPIRHAIWDLRESGAVLRRGSHGFPRYRATP